MTILKILRFLLPASIRRYMRSKIDHVIGQIKAPRMVCGYIDAMGEWRSRTRISDTVFMYHPERIKIADNVFVWHYTILDGTGGLKIGEGSQIGAWVGIFTHSSHIAIRLYGNHYQEVLEDQKKGYLISSVKIGKYVFIGAGAKILPGVTIGDGALVSSGAIVTRSIGEFEIVSGNPAKVIGNTRSLDKQYLNDPKLLAWYEEWQKK